MIKTDVVDESECHLKCLGNNSCKSFNVPHKDDNNAKIRFCELNNETRETKPRDFKEKKGSAYYGSVQVSKFLGWRTFSGLDKAAFSLFI